MGPMRSRWVSVRSMVAAVVFGLAAMAIMAAGLTVPIPGAGVAVDAREVLVALGAALTGPFGGLIIGFLAGLINAAPGVAGMAVVQHMIRGAFVGWAYARVQRKVPMPGLIVFWIGILVIYYYLIALPTLIGFVWADPDLITGTLGGDYSISEIVRTIFRAGIPEFLFTAFVTSIALAALPPRYRRPMFGEMEFAPAQPREGGTIVPPEQQVHALPVWRLLGIAALLGLMGGVLSWGAVSVPFPGELVVFDPGEVFAAIAAALTGPWFGMLTGTLVTISGATGGMPWADLFLHLLACVWFAWAYQRFAFPVRTGARLFLTWSLLVLGYYGILSFLPAVALVTLGPVSAPLLLRGVTSATPVTLTLLLSWIPEYLLTTLVSGVALSLLPERMRRPLWKAIVLKPEVTDGSRRRTLASRWQGSLGVRLALWFILFSVVPLGTIGFFIQNDVTAGIGHLAGIRQQNRAKMVARMVEAQGPEAAFRILQGEDAAEWPRNALVDTSGGYVAGVDLDSIDGGFEKATTRRFAQVSDGSVLQRSDGRVVGFARVPGRPWIAVTWIEGTTLAQQVDVLERALFLKLSIALLIISLAGGIAIWVIVARPMNTLSDAVRKVSGGELAVRLDPSAMDDEIAVLGSAFNEMTANLQAVQEGFLEEISARAQAQEQLRERERQFRLLAENSMDMISRHAPDSTYLYASPACTMLLGYSAMELVGKNAFELIHPDDHGIVRANFAAIHAADGVPSVTYRIRRRDGTYVWVESSSRSLWNQQHTEVTEIQVATRDVTLRKNAEAALVESEERLRAIVTNIPLILFAFDRAGVFILSEGRGLSVLGLRPGEVVGRSVYDVYKDYPGILDGVQRALKGEHVFAAAMIEGNTFDVWYGPVRGRNNEVVGLIGVASDVTERHRMEEELRRSEQVYRSLVEQSSDAIYVLQDRRLVYVNRAWETLFGYSAEEACTPSFDLRSIVAEDSRTTVEERLRAYEMGTMPALRYEMKALTRVGDEMVLDVSVTRINWNGRTAIQGVYRDVTASKREDAQTLQRQKIESLGVLAGGVAHDFNNLLQAILGHISLAVKRIPPGNPAGENIMKAEKAAERAADLTRQLLAYSGKGRFEVRPLNINQMIRENLHLLEVGVHKTIRLQQELQNDLPMIEADAGQVQQVIMNLIINASEAIGEKPGRILIRTRVMQLRKPDADRWSLPDMPLAEGTYVLLEVSDDGSGMSPETVRKIFDPFFTTKFTGRGLGLSAVLGILKGHRGGVQVRSELGEGTTFSLIFPAVEKAPGTKEDANTALRAPSVEGIVLVVDDESGVRDVLVDMLDAAGIRTLTARDGEEALSVYAAHRREVGVVLLDLSMPGIGGKETFRRLRGMSATVPVILSSGFSETEARADLDGLALAGFIQKPYRWETLVQRLVDALRAPDPSAGGRP